MNTRSLALPGLLFIATCCPSVWMTVHKTGAPPKPFVERTNIVQRRIPIPPDLPNRVDVLEHGKPMTVGDPIREAGEGDDVVAVRAAALATVSRLIGRYGNGAYSPRLKCESVPATLDCTPARGCDAVIIDAGLTDTRPSHIRVAVNGAEVTSIIESCEPVGAEPTGTLEEPCHIRWTGATRIGLHDKVAALDAAAPTTACIGSPEPPQTLLSFVHVSDIQIRDSTVRLENPELSRRLDWVIPSFQYDPDQELYNAFVVDALFATINAEVALARATNAAEAPSLVIHTGDIIDAGVMSELRTAHSLVDRLRIPFYDVLGNHDMLVFGNLLPTDGTSDDTCVSMQSLAGYAFKAPRFLLANKLCVTKDVECADCLPGEAAFVAGANIEESHRNFIAGLGHADIAALPKLRSSVEQTDHTCAEIRGHSTRNHGFDLNKDLGYYAFTVNLPRGGHAIFISLDSEDLAANVGGAGGRIGKDQLAWLERVLACAKKSDVVLVFSHHSIGGIATEGPRSLETMLYASDRVIGHFYGHHHEHGICRDNRPGVCSRFWEVETASVLEFPQEARMVRLKTLDNHLAYFEVFTFEEQEKIRSREVALARQGAERDHCLTKRQTERAEACTPQHRPIRSDGRHTNARLFFKLPSGM